MTDFINSVVDIFSGVLDSIIELLPLSPFARFTYMTLDSGLLALLNYFLPIAEIVSVLQLWLIAVAGYYIYKFILKFIRME